MDKDVWLTGIGLVSALGIGWEENWAALCDGRSGIGPVRRFDPTGMRVRIGAEVPERFDAGYRARVRVPFPRRQARFTRLALMAVELALEDAGVDTEREDRTRIGVSIGVGAGSFHYMRPINDALAAGADSVEAVIDHNFVIKYMANAAAAQICMWKGIEGPSTTVSAACASGAQAIAQGIDWIREGRVDLALAGGTDATVDRFVLDAYDKVNVLSRRNDAPARAMRPFDRDRDGFAMGEGAGVLVLESERHARARRAHRRARLLGHACTNEAHKLVAPREDGAGVERTIRLALEAARVPADAIGYISAHGTATPVSDRVETRGIKRAFGERAYRVPISSQKSMFGHPIGASSAIEIAVSALTLEHGVITPTANLERADADCDLDYVPGDAREAATDHALSNAFGFGGHNCCVVLGR